MNILISQSIHHGIKNGRITAKNNPDYNEAHTLNLSKMVSNYNSRKTALHLYAQHKEKHKTEKKKQTQSTSKLKIVMQHSSTPSDLSSSSFNTIATNTPSLSPAMSYSAPIPSYDIGSINISDDNVSTACTDIDMDLTDYSDSDSDESSSSFTTYDNDQDTVATVLCDKRRASVDLHAAKVEHNRSDSDSLVYAESSDEDESDDHQITRTNENPDGYQYPWSAHESSDDEFLGISEQKTIEKIMAKLKITYEKTTPQKQGMEDEKSVQKEPDMKGGNDYNVDQYFDKENGRYLSMIIYESDVDGDDEGEEQQDSECVDETPLLPLSQTLKFFEYYADDDGGCNDIEETI
eukprot:268598_1